MADKTKIEWTEATWNPVTGCTKVSPGCKHCYAERDWARLSKNPKTAYYGREFTDVRCHIDRLDHPLRWKKPRRIFVNSMSDLFHPNVPYQFIADVFGVMAACPQHTFQILTKRPERMHTFLASGCMASFEDDIAEAAALYTDVPPVLPLPNVWLGVSIEDQMTADERIPLLLQTPAAVRFLSIEPLLGYVDFYKVSAAMPNEGHPWSNRPTLGGIHWVVAGGESGPKARPMRTEWVRALRDQCKASDVRFLFKQWGEFLPAGQVDKNGDEWTPISMLQTPVMDNGFRRIGKRNAGRLLDSVLHDAYPEAV